MAATWAGSFEGLESIWESQRFDLLGVESDNGGEFLNFHRFRGLKKHAIKQTCSRACDKNDQAYGERKNLTRVRPFLGYERLVHRELLEDLNELPILWSQWRNLFCVTRKQESKRREGSRPIRRHEKQGKDSCSTPHRQRRAAQRRAGDLCGRSSAVLRSARRGQQTNNRKPSRHGGLVMMQWSRSVRNLSVCSVHEAAGWRDTDWFRQFSDCRAGFGRNLRARRLMDVVGGEGLGDGGAQGRGGGLVAGCLLARRCGERCVGGWRLELGGALVEDPG